MLDDYEFVGSLTADERFAGTSGLSCSEHTPPPRGEGGVLRVILPNVEFGLYLY